MRRAKTGYRWIALAAALALLGLTARTEVAYGAVKIETDKKCSITFSLNGNYQQKVPESEQEPESAEYEKGEGYAELQELEIAVDLYQVAAVDVSGTYKAFGSNTTLYDLLAEDLAKVSSATSAAEWMTMAEKAAARVEEGGRWGTSLRTTTLNSPVPGQEKTVENLLPGLYLVVAHEAVSPEYVYTFTPYLISLPGNDYYSGGDNDEWQYDVNVGLKASQTNRFGDLLIEKTLDSYNASLGETTAVFQIDAVKDEFYYRDVVSIVFSQAGTRSVLVKGRIPAGAAVTVTEVYSGASYQGISELEQTAPPIAASDEWGTADASTVRFVNTYDDDRLSSGTSIVNHFIQDGYYSGEGTDVLDTENSRVWDVEQLKDSAGQAGEE